MVTISYVDPNGNTIRFTVPDTVAFNIVERLKEAKAKSLTWRAWKEVYTLDPPAM